MFPTTEAYPDVVELCALLQCLGFSVKSLNTSDGNMSQDGGARTVVINCKASGLQLEMESGSSSCSCQHNSGVWHVAGSASGQRLPEEFECSILGSMPKAHWECLTKELRTMMRCIRENSESEEKANTTSGIEIKVWPPSPEQRQGMLKPETPTRYRSLDTLTAAKELDQQLPTPGLLQKKLILADTSTEDVTDNKKLLRTDTYILWPPSGSDNKTSSPLQQPRSVVLENLIAAEKAAEELRQQLSTIIKQFADEGKDDSSMSSPALDVSKISLLKVSEPMKAQVGSCPNLSGLGVVYEDMKKNKLKSIESASGSDLMTQKMPSKMRRIKNIFKPKSVTPKEALKSESSPNLSASKKRFSHIKSTIPKPTPRKANTKENKGGEEKEGL